MYFHLQPPPFFLVLSTNLISSTLFLAFGAASGEFVIKCFAFHHVLHGLWKITRKKDNETNRVRIYEEVEDHETMKTRHVVCLKG